MLDLVLLDLDVLLREERLDHPVLLVEGALERVLEQLLLRRLSLAALLSLLVLHGLLRDDGDGSGLDDCLDGRDHLLGGLLGVVVVGEAAVQALLLLQEHCQWSLFVFVERSVDLVRAVLLLLKVFSQSLLL